MSRTGGLLAAEEVAGDLVLVSSCVGTCVPRPEGPASYRATPLPAHPDCTALLAAMKGCTACGRTLELDEFPMDRGRRYSKCLTCKAAQVARHYQIKRQRRWAAEGLATMPR